MTDTQTRLPHRILVIDDNTAIHEDFCKILTRSVEADTHLSQVESALFGAPADRPVAAAFQIDCATQGKEGLEMARRAQAEGRPYALAFVDGRMPPGWDGIETIGHLWRACPQLQAVLCTAYADYSWQEIRRVLGESDSLLILKKPFDNVEVLQLAHALTRKWELAREVQAKLENLGEMVQRQMQEKESLGLLLEAALKHSPAGIVISDATATAVRYANPAARRICDPLCLILPTATDQCAAWMALHPDGTAFKETPFTRSIRQGVVIRDEEVLLRREGGPDKFILFNAAPIHDADGSVAAGIIVIQDVTERKQAEREQKALQNQLSQAQRMESIGLLAGGVAHDFNNMLGVILGHAEISLLRIEPTDPVHKSLLEIQKAGQRSVDLTRQLLGFARRQTVAPKVLDLNTTLAGMLTMLERLIGEDVELRWKPGEALWTVKIDPSQVDQILTNLAANARDALSGGGQLIVETYNATIDKGYCMLHPAFTPGQYVVLAVSDNGRGIDKQSLNHIFEPFFTTKELGKGTGLGLATVYGIVKQNNGFISVQSEPDQGTVFTIYLPRWEGETVAPLEDIAPLTFKGRGETVLVVEDEENNLNVSKSILEELGYVVRAARTPGEALLQAQSHAAEIELLLTDVVMPEMNGRELVQTLQGFLPDLKYLFMSGYTADVIAHRGILDEGVRFIQKPFTMAELAAKVRAALDRQEVGRIHFSDESGEIRGGEAGE
jgi:signal transduction histidine kinase/DNA-binding NtrC family response regulator